MNAVTKSPSVPREVKSAPAIRPVLVPHTFDQLVIFAEMAATSGMVPKDYEGKPGAIMVAVQMGSELGLAPMQALANIACINGRPSVWGDALPGLCRQSGQCEDIQEWFEGEGDRLTAYCKAIRIGSNPVVRSFSVEDAKRASLWKDGPKTTKTGKNGTYQVDSGPWWSYPKRMLQMRARGFALRDAFPDVLRGLISAEEARDIPVDDFRGTTLDATPESRPAQTAAGFIGDAIPDRVMKPETKKPTARMWLDDLRATLTACHSEEEVTAISETPEVVMAMEKLKNAPLLELKSMLAEALDRVRVDDGSSAAEPVPDDDDIFPGDRP